MRKIVDFIRLWPEVFSLPAALIVWLASPYLLHLLDSTSVPFDSGVLHIILYAIIGILTFNGVVFMGIKFNFPVLFEFYKEEAGEAFNNITSWQKLKVLLCLYLGLLLALVHLATSLRGIQ